MKLNMIGLCLKKMGEISLDVDTPYLYGAEGSHAVFLQLIGDLNIEDCSKLSSKIEDKVEELIEHKFFLEVSSPGLERPLKKLEDYIRFTGEKITLHLKHKLDDKKQFKAIIKEVNGNNIIFLIDNKEIEIKFNEIRKANEILEEQTEKITEKFKKDKMKLEEKLNRSILKLKKEQSDVQITFNLPRDDDRTINSISKNIKEYNHTKLALQQEVYRYLNNEKKCRSQQLLEYFGEKTTHPCGICSNCIAHHKPKKIDKKQVREELWELLKKAPIRPSDILIKMPYTKEVINPILEEWLITEKIEKFEKLYF